jgi:hypothetical protein
MGLGDLRQVILRNRFVQTKGPEKMKVLFQITSNETGKVVIRRRKIAKALRWWLRERGIVYDYAYFLI